MPTSSQSIFLYLFFLVKFFQSHQHIKKKKSWWKAFSPHGLFFPGKQNTSVEIFYILKNKPFTAQP